MRRHPSAIQSKPNKGSIVPPKSRLLVYLAVLAVMLAIGFGVAAYRNAHAETGVVALLTARTTTGGCSSTYAGNFHPVRVYAANGSTSAGSGSATIEMRAGMSPTNINVVLGTVTLTLSTDPTAAAANGGFTTQANWPYTCAAVTAISGTGASVNANVGAN